MPQLSIYQKLKLHVQKGTNFERQPFAEQENFVSEIVDVFRDFSNTLSLTEKYDILMSIPALAFAIPKSFSFNIASLFLLHNDLFKFNPEQSFTLLNHINLDSRFITRHTQTSQPMTLSMALAVYNKAIGLSPEQLVHLFKKCDLTILDNTNQSLGHHISENNIYSLYFSFEQFLDIYQKAPVDLLEKEVGVFYFTNPEMIKLSLLEVERQYHLIKHEWYIKNTLVSGRLAQDIRPVNDTFEYLKNEVEAQNIINTLVTTKQNKIKTL